MLKKVISLGNKKIGEGQPCFIVAEMSGNHKQDIRRAYKIIDAAVEAGVDAVKLQTYTPDTLTINCNKKWFRIGKTNSWAGQTLYDLYKTAYTPWDWQPKLKAYADKKGILLFSTPFDVTAVNFLEEMDVVIYKVASFESIDLELLKRIGKTRKPVLLSRGLTAPSDIKFAVDTLHKSGAPAVVVLQCVSSYPATLDQMHLADIPDIKRRFKTLAGLSDHSLGLTASITAVAKGACVIEKHFTLSRKDGGPDYAFSLEPNEMKELVKTIREIETAIGKVSYTPDKRESENIVFRRSLFAVTDIKKGEKLNQKNIRSIRPGYGLMPKYLNKVLGKTAKVNIEYGTPLSWEIITK